MERLISQQEWESLGKKAGYTARAKLGSAAGRKCVDCGRPADRWDHRDYRKPLEVEPVCRSCNWYRARALPEFIPDREIRQQHKWAGIEGGLEEHWGSIPEHYCHVQLPTEDNIFTYHNKDDGEVIRGRYWNNGPIPSLPFERAIYYWREFNERFVGES